MYGGGMYGGGMYGGMGMGMNPMMMGQMGWLGAMHQTVGNLGQMTELLGMNAEAIQYAFGAFAHFVERIGGAAHEVIGFFTGAPPLPQIDPHTGQPLPLPSPEEIKAERRRRMIRWLIGIVILYAGYRGIKIILKRMSRSKTPNENMLSQQWDSINNQGGLMPAGAGSMMANAGGMYGMYNSPGMYGSPMYGNSMYGSQYGNGSMYGSSMYGSSPYGSSMYSNSMYGNRMYGNGVGDGYGGMNTAGGPMNEFDDIFG